MELTTTEHKMLIEASLGKTAKDIGNATIRSHRTVQKHWENIRKKLGCKKIYLAIQKARRLGLLEDAT